MAIATAVLLPAAGAMDLVHYDLDSLTYLSTDIVLAEISVMGDHRFAATVTDTLQGPLVKGVRLERLSEFLMFFQPMENGQKVVLFLDRRPRKPIFLFPEASKSLFAVPSSGVYLIDAYQHIHEYYQQDNPGPYVAEGYQYLPPYRAPPEPTKEQDLALPSLREVEARISASLKWVQSIRPLLDKVADRGDIPLLMSLLKKRLERANTCDGRNKDAMLNILY